MLNAGESYIQHIPADRIARRSSNAGRFQAIDDFTRLGEAGRDHHLRPDAAHAAPRAGPPVRRADGRRDRAAAAVAASSSASRAPPTPGTTEEVVLPRLDRRRASRSGEDFFLAFSPEREDPGNRDFHDGDDPEGRRRHHRAPAASSPAALYAEVIERVVPGVVDARRRGDQDPREHLPRGEHRARERAEDRSSTAMGIDVWEVIEAARTKPFGFQAVLPGPRPRRALHPDRPVLPHVEGARVRRRDALHRAGRRGQQRACRSTSSTRLADGAERAAKAGERVAASSSSAWPTSSDVDDIRESPALDILQLV